MGDGDPYVEGIYAPIESQIERHRWPAEVWRDPEALAARLGEVDAVHIQWPDILIGLDLDLNRRVIETLRASGVRILWTQHDASPHADPVWHSPLFQAWADIADGLIHHSRWSVSEMERRYCFKPGAAHRVIWLAHWGDLLNQGDDLNRAAAERELGLSPCDLRIGIFAAPRPAKDLQLLIDGFAACRRDDLQLLVLNLQDEVVPSDPRITALPYQRVSRAVYNRRLRAIDVVAMPFRSGLSSLATGTVADAVALGLPGLVSDWGYLTEIMGEAGIVYGSSRADLTRCLDRLDAETVRQAATASKTLQIAYDSHQIALQTLSFIEELVGFGNSSSDMRA